jgi:hypothetical protein
MQLDASDSTVRRVQFQCRSGTKYHSLFLIRGTNGSRNHRPIKAFSKKLENHYWAIALHYMHYNFCRIHRTLRVTPAMATGVTDHVWDVSDIAALLDSK